MCNVRNVLNNDFDFKIKLHCNYLQDHFNGVMQIEVKLFIVIYQTKIRITTIRAL